MFNTKQTQMFVYYTIHTLSLNSHKIYSSPYSHAKIFQSTHNNKSNKIQNNIGSNIIYKIYMKKIYI